MPAMGYNQIVKNKIDFLQTDLEVTKTLLDRARAHKEQKNQEDYQRLRGEIEKALKTIGKFLRDDRVVIPANVAADLSALLEARVAEYNTVYGSMG